MPRNGYSKGRSRSAFVASSDIRLVDYANASLPSSESARISKGAANANTVLLRKAQHWWELDGDKAFSDLDCRGSFDGEDLPGDDTSDVGEGNSNQLNEYEENHHHNKNGSDTMWKEERKYSVYPPDVWYLIAEYIPPEDVKHFAAVCRNSYAVTRSSRFWRQLYNRFYDPTKLNLLPEQFRPAALQRAYGLRTRVIKALFYVHQPFAERVRIPSGVSLSSESIAKVCRSVCQSSWWEQQRESSGKAVWKFFFKFRSSQLNKNSSRYQSKLVPKRNRNTRKNALDYLDDTWANLEDRCAALRVSCNQYTQIPNILGWKLSELSISLCSDMRSHRMKLTFACRLGAGSGGQVEVAVLEGVQDVAVLDWWHPQYPAAVL